VVIRKQIKNILFSSKACISLTNASTKDNSITLTKVRLPFIKINYFFSGIDFEHDLRNISESLMIFFSGINKITRQQVMIKMVNMQRFLEGII